MLYVLNYTYDQFFDLVPKLCDFGLARQKATDTFTRYISQHPAGTLAYMAPEVEIELQTPQYPADIWSLGITSIEWFTGKRAWGLPEGTTDIRRVLREKKQCGLAPDGLVDVPEIMRRVLKTSLLHNPLERPTARTILEDLKHLIGRSTR